MRSFRIPLAIILGIALLLTGNAWAMPGTKMVVKYLWGDKELQGMPQPLQIVSHNSLEPSKTVTSFLRKVPQPTLSRTSLREEAAMAGRERGTKRVVSLLKRG